MFLLTSAFLGCSNKEAPPAVDCSIDSGPCSRTLEGDRQTQVILDINPKPVASMKRLNFTVQAVRRGLPFEDADVSISLSMPGMSMMENIVHLRKAQGGWYSGEGVIVRCPSGGKVWRADISVSRPGSPGEDLPGVSFQFRVNR